LSLAARPRFELLLGDAITGPIQLDEPSWHSFGDVHPDLAERTRERLWAGLPPARRWVGPGS
jgi:hypothetical protein